MGKHGYKGFMKANRGSGGGAAKTHSHQPTHKTSHKLHHKHVTLHMVSQAQAIAGKSVALNDDIYS